VATEKPVPWGLWLVFFLYGIVAFAVGFGLDKTPDYRDLWPDYGASMVMPGQFVVGSLLVFITAVATHHARIMTLWTAHLWMLGGLMVAWMAWAVALFAL
jgi:hypothetical protein